MALAADTRSPLGGARVAMVNADERKIWQNRGRWKGISRITHCPTREGKRRSIGK